MTPPTTSAPRSSTAAPTASPTRSGSRPWAASPRAGLLPRHLPGGGSANPGGSVTSTVNTTTVSGAAQTVALSVSGAPSGVSATLSPTSVQSGQSSTLSVQVGAGTAQGTYTLTVTGTGTTSHSTTYTLTVGGGGGTCTPRQVVVNGGFENGSSPWTASSGVITNQAARPRTAARTRRG